MAEGVRRTVLETEHPDGPRDLAPEDWVLRESHMLQVAGTVIQLPYGNRVITFPSKRHFFRGERKQYEITVPSSPVPARRDAEHAFSRSA